MNLTVKEVGCCEDRETVRVQGNCLLLIVSAEIHTDKEMESIVSENKVAALRLTLWNVLPCNIKGKDFKNEVGLKKEMQTMEKVKEEVLGQSLKKEESGV